MVLTRQLVSFGSVGVINTVIDVGSYAALVALGAPLFGAIFVATSLGLLSSYFLNHRFTFEQTAHRSSTLIHFLVVTLTGLWLLQPLMIFSLTTIFSLHSVAALTAAKLAATAVTLVWNFCWYRTKVFTA